MCRCGYVDVWVVVDVIARRDVDWERVYAMCMHTWMD